MITNIWLKSQPNKKISYPDCYIWMHIKTFEPWIDILNKDNTKTLAFYKSDVVSRVEFRP